MFFQESVKEIIQKTEQIKGDRELYLSVFGALEKRQNEFLQRLQEQVKQEGEKNPATGNWNIVTALVPVSEEEEARKNGLFPYYVFEKEEEKKQVARKIAFLNCSYPKLEQYQNQVYHAELIFQDGSRQEVPYRLFFSDLFLNQERLLERVAAQNEIARPYLYAPFSRRAVEIILDWEGDGKKEAAEWQLDLKLEENGLGGVLLTEYELMWNLEVTDQDEMGILAETDEKRIMAYFDKEYTIYNLPCEEGKEYVFLSSEHAIVKKNGSKFYLGVDSQSKIEDIEYVKIRICEVPESFWEKCQYLYSNQENKTGIRKERIRTEGDLVSVITQVAGDLEYQGSSSEKGSSVLAYDSRREYHYPKSDRLRSSSIRYLKFQPPVAIPKDTAQEKPGSLENSDTVRMFWEDRISYLLAFLNYQYPEFIWVGVC